LATAMAATKEFCRPAPVEAAARMTSAIWPTAEIGVSVTAITLDLASRASSAARWVETA